MTRFPMPMWLLIILGAAVVAWISGHAVARDTDHNDHDDHDHAAEHPDHPDDSEPGSHAEKTVHGGDPDHAGHEDHHDAVRLSPEELIEFGIDIAVAGPGRIESRLQLPGEVRTNGDRLAHIVPRYSGIVTEVRAHIGDHVEMGRVLAVVESDESLAPFEVKTLISGTVVSKHITLGEAVSRDRDAFVIADLSSVWIDLAVYQQDLDRVRVGQSADLYVGHDLTGDTGRINYVTPILDEHTRTATARIILPNPDGAWLPGMFVTARVLVEETDVPVAIPRTALQTIDGDTVVFVETDHGFEPRPLTLGRLGHAHVEVLDGLDDGERYAAHGAFTLKAELGKASFGDGHAH